MDKYTESTKEAADRLGLTPSRIRQLCLAGEIDAKREGSPRRGEWKIRSGAMPRKNSQK